MDMNAWIDSLMTKALLNRSPLGQPSVPVNEYLIMHDDDANRDVMVSVFVNVMPNIRNAPEAGTFTS